MIAFLIKILPKIGPLKVFKFKEVGPEGEKQFIKSFDTVMFRYSDALARLQNGNIQLPNLNFDTGKPTAPEEYELVDETYGQLALKLQENKFSYLLDPLKQDITNFYKNADTLAISKKDASGWKKASHAIYEVKYAIPISADSLKSAEAIQDQKRVAKNPTGK